MLKFVSYFLLIHIVNVLRIKFLNSKNYKENLIFFEQIYFFLELIIILLNKQLI